MTTGLLSKPQIIIAKIQDIDHILSIRENQYELKFLETEYIKAHISEFVLCTIDGKIGGIMRIFTPLNCKSVLEMGSFVKSKECSSLSGICTSLIQYAELISTKTRKTIIAITQPQKWGWKDLATHLSRLNWESATYSERYQNRMQESQWKVLWQKSPKRIDPDSTQIYL